MAIFSGKDGHVKKNGVTIGRVTHWEFTPRSRNPSWISNATGGHRGRVAGVKDGSGRFEGKLDAAGHAPVAEGDLVTLQLHVDASGENYIVAPVIVDEAPLAVDVNGGSIVGYVARFSTRGAWTRVGALATS